MSVPGSLPPSRPLSRAGSRVSQLTGGAGSGVLAGPGLEAGLDAEVQGNAYVEEAEAIIRNLTDDKERLRKLAMGDKYEIIGKMDEKMLVESAEDFRQAKLYRQLRLHEGMQNVELEERLKLLNVEEKILMEERHRLGTAAQLMKKRARQKFAKEAEASRWLEQEKYEADKKFIIDAERERLVRKRREFEVSMSSRQPTHFSSAAKPVTQPHPTQENDVTLVMTVGLGDGREDILTVREGDDYRALATQFATNHRLPTAVIEPLVKEIRMNASNTSYNPRQASPAASSHHTFNPQLPDYPPRRGSYSQHR